MAAPLKFGDWKAQVERFAAKVPMDQITKLQRTLVLLAMGAAVTLPNGGLARLTGIVPRTPVDTGRARASWQVTIGEPGREVPPEGGAHREPGATDALQAMAGLQPGQTVWITSALPYILVLEFGGYPNPPRRGSYDKKTKSWVVKSAGGFSRQAPQGMVRVTFEELKRIVTEAVL
jgi:hypothetical protein